MRRQNIDVTNFEESLEDFKDKFGRNYRLASDRFAKAIEEIDKTIEHLQKTKENAAGFRAQPAPGERQGRSAHREAPGARQPHHAGQVRGTARGGPGARHVRGRRRRGRGTGLRQGRGDGARGRQGRGGRGRRTRYRPAAPVSVVEWRGRYMAPSRPNVLLNSVTVVAPSSSGKARAGRSVRGMRTRRASVTCGLNGLGSKATPRAASCSRTARASRSSCGVDAMPSHSVESFARPNFPRPSLRSEAGARPCRPPPRRRWRRLSPVRRPLPGRRA